MGRSCIECGRTILEGKISQRTDGLWGGEFEALQTCKVWVNHFVCEKASGDLIVKCLACEKNNREKGTLWVNRKEIFNSCEFREYKRR